MLCDCVGGVRGNECVLTLNQELKGKACRL